MTEEFTTRPCETCGEDTYNERLCRECGIEESLDRIHCSGCHRMRYRQDEQLAAEIGRALWGDPCVCDPRPPSVLELKKVEPNHGA